MLTIFFNVVVFIDIALPWNCNALSVKTLEFQVWFGLNTFLWQTFSLKNIHAYLWFLMVLRLFGRKGISVVKNIFVGVLAGRKGTRHTRLCTWRILNNVPGVGVGIILLIMLSIVPIFSTVPTWQNCVWYLF